MLRHLPLDPIDPNIIDVFEKYTNVDPKQETKRGTIARHENTQQTECNNQIENRNNPTEDQRIRVGR